MNPIYISLLSALGGAIIGSLSSIATIFVQAKVAERRERIRQAALMAMEEYKVQVQNAPRRRQGVSSLSVFASPSGDP